MSFDLVAPWYETLERLSFGNTLQRCRVACLNEVVRPGRILILGEGNGRFLGQFVARYPGVTIDCVDASERMLRLAQRRLMRVVGHPAETVQWLCRDITVWNPPEDFYDLIVTHFVLDCFTKPELASIVQKLGRAATKQATWLLADFCVPNGGIVGFQARACLAVMYRFFRVTSGISANELIDPTPFVQGEGFVLEHRHVFRKGMLKSEIWRRAAI